MSRVTTFRNGNAACPRQRKFSGMPGGYVPLAAGKAGGRLPAAGSPLSCRAHGAGRAERQLDAARRRFLEERHLAEATLATLDLAVVYEETERRSEVDALIADLEARSEGLGGRDVALEVLRGFASEHLRGRTPASAPGCIRVNCARRSGSGNLRSGGLPWI